MKTSKIITKFKEIGLTVGIKIENENKIKVDVFKNHLNDPDLEKILKAFPSKKYDVSVKASKDSLVLEISKKRFKILHPHDFLIPPFSDADVPPIRITPFRPINRNF